MILSVTHRQEVLLLDKDSVIHVTDFVDCRSVLELLLEIQSVIIELGYDPDYYPLTPYRSDQSEGEDAFRYTSFCTRVRDFVMAEGTGYAFLGGMSGETFLRNLEVLEADQWLDTEAATIFSWLWWGWIDIETALSLARVVGGYGASPVVIGYSGGNEPLEAATVLTGLAKVRRPVLAFDEKNRLSGLVSEFLYDQGLPIRSWNKKVVSVAVSEYVRHARNRARVHEAKPPILLLDSWTPQDSIKPVMEKILSLDCSILANVGVLDSPKKLSYMCSTDEGGLRGVPLYSLFKDSEGCIRFLEG